MSARSRRPILLLTPYTRFGSWAWLEKALAESPDTPVIVVGYGHGETIRPGVRFVLLPPIIDYGKWVTKLAERRYLALNVLYYAPLAPIAWWIALRHRTHLLIANGVNSAAILMPLTVLDRRLVLAFHGSVEHAGPTWHRILRLLLSRVDRAFVNSDGSRTDLAHVIDVDRISIIRHWADDVFFDQPLERPSAKRLRVLFVGRLDTEKFAHCLRVCRRLAEEGVVELSAAGTGPLETHLDRPGLRHVGYIADKSELAELYSNTDVVWAAADVTYLSLPGVEGLASGCPLIVSETPAVFTHARAGLKVPRDLIPGDVGRVIDGEDDLEALDLLRAWARDGIPLSVRELCRSYALERHSTSNLDVFVQEFDVA